MASPCLTTIITTFELLNPHAMLLTVNCVLILTLSEEAESYISPKHAEMLHSTCTLLNSQTRFPQCHTRTPSLPAYMHIQWTICLISNISGHYGSYSSRSGWYTHEQGKKKGGGTGRGGAFQRAFKSFLRKKSQYTVTCTQQAAVHFKLNPHVSAENTHTGIKKFSLFHHKGGLYRDLMRDLSGSILTNTNRPIPWNPRGSQEKAARRVTGQSHHQPQIHDKSHGHSKADTPTASRPDAVLGAFP